MRKSTQVNYCVALSDLSKSKTVDITHLRNVQIYQIVIENVLASE